MRGILAMIVAVVLLAACSHGPDMNTLTRDVKATLAQEIQSEVPADVVDLQLVKSTDRTYKGLAYVRTAWGGNYDWKVPVDVTVGDDGKHLVEVPRGGMFELLQAARKHDARVQGRSP